MCVENVLHGMRGPVTCRTAEPTSQTSPITAASTSTLVVVRFSPKLPAGQVDSQFRCPPIEFLAGERIDRLIRAPVVAPIADEVAGDTARPLRARGGGYGDAIDRCLAMPVTVGLPALGRGAPTFVDKMWAGMPHTVCRELPQRRPARLSSSQLSSAQLSDDGPSQPLPRRPPQLEPLGVHGQPQAGDRHPATPPGRPSGRRSPTRRRAKSQRRTTRR
jgi:hypothetical protein